MQGPSAKPSRRWKASFTAFAMASLLPLSAHALSVEAQGIGFADFDPGSGSSAVPPNVRQLALQHAEEDELRRYAAGFKDAKAELYRRAEPSIINNAGTYLSTPILVDEGYKAGQRQYFVVIRASIDVSRLDAAIAVPGVSARGAPQNTRKISLSFLFVAKEFSSVKEFDARITNVEQDQSSTDARQGSGLSGGRARYSSSTSKTESTVTGGNTVMQADQTVYRVSSPDDMNAKMSEVFTDANFDVADYADVSVNCSGVKPVALYRAFATSDEISPELRAQMFGAARRCNINAFTYGSVTTTSKDIDPSTGLIRVFVKVRAVVYDLSGPLPKKLASVGPIQDLGLGPVEDVAKTNALIKAVTDVAQEITNQLNVKGLN